MVYVPIGGVDHAACQGVFDKGKRRPGSRRQGRLRRQRHHRRLPEEARRRRLDGLRGVVRRERRRRRRRRRRDQHVGRRAHARQGPRRREEGVRGLAQAAARRRPLQRRREEALAPERGRAPHGPGPRGEHRDAQEPRHDAREPPDRRVAHGLGARRDLRRRRARAHGPLRRGEECARLLPERLRATGQASTRATSSNQPYRISVVRYFGTGEEEADCEPGRPEHRDRRLGPRPLGGAPVREAAGATLAWLDTATPAAPSGTAPRTASRAARGQPRAERLDLGTDSSIWEVHEAKKRHYAYTTLTAARGFCDMAGIAKKANKAPTSRTTRTSRRRSARASSRRSSIRRARSPARSRGSARASTSTARSPRRSRGTSSTTGRATPRRRRSISSTSCSVDSGGYKRNDDGLCSYDNNEWILVDLRIANALRRAGRGDEADGIVAHVVSKAAANFYLVPELYNDTSRRGRDRQLHRLDPDGRLRRRRLPDDDARSLRRRRADDCGDGKGAGAPVVSARRSRRTPAARAPMPTAARARAGTAACPTARRSRSSPRASACSVPIAASLRYGLALFLSIPVLLLARRGSPPASDDRRALRSRARRDREVVRWRACAPRRGPRRSPGRDPRAVRRERRRQVDAPQGAVRRVPATSYKGTVRVRGGSVAS